MHTESAACREAIRLLGMGLSPVPITSPLSLASEAPGKAPIGSAWGATRHTEDSLRAIYAANYDAGVGILLGQAGGVIDVEMDGCEDAYEAFAEIMGGELVETMGWTSRRGPHALFRWDDRLAKYARSKFGTFGIPGVEVRIGALPDSPKQVQSVCPPSLIGEKDAHGVVSIVGRREWNGIDSIAALPDAFFAFADRLLAEEEARREASRSAAIRPGAAVTADDDSIRRYAQAAFDAELGAVESAPPKGRNNQLNASAFVLGQLVAARALDRSSVESALKVAAERIGQGQREAEKTIRSGLESGMDHPRDLSGIVGAVAGPKPTIGRGKAKGSVGSVGTTSQVQSSKNGGSVGFVGDPPQVQSPEFDREPGNLKGELLPVDRLDGWMLPDNLRPWLVDIARRGCFPLEYPASSALVALASLVGRNLMIRPKRNDDWTVVPNIWGAIVGPPGMQKTPAVAETFLPIKRMIADAIREHAAALERHREDMLIREVEAAEAKKKLAKGIKTLSEQDRRELAAEATNDGKHTKEPAPRRYMVNDATVEKLGEILKDNARGVLQFRDELGGFFRAMDRQGHEADRGFYLECWDGNGSYTFDRISRGTVTVSALCLSIFGTIQPGPLARYIKGSAGGQDADGFMPRFQMLVYPDPPAAFVNIDERPDRDAQAAANRVFAWIDRIDPAFMDGAEYDERRDVYFLRFDDEAQPIFDDWRHRLENRLRSGADGPLLSEHLAKFRSLMPSLALVFHLIDQCGAAALDPVSLKAAELAIAWCDFLESHARRAYQMAMDGDPELASRLAEKIRRGSLPNPFTCRVAANKGWAGLDNVDAVRKAVGILEDRGWVKVVEEAPSAKGGRPSEQIWINPQVGITTKPTKPESEASEAA